MKNILLIFIVLFAFISIESKGQKYIYPPNSSSTAWDDTIQADTNYYPSATGYLKTPGVVGSVSFTFYHTDVDDSLSYARLEWSDDLVTWTAMTGNAALSETTTDGQDKVYTSTPLLHRYYRAALACASGDTVAITNPTLMRKEE